MLHQLPPACPAFCCVQLQLGTSGLQPSPDRQTYKETKKPVDFSLGFTFSKWREERIRDKIWQRQQLALLPSQKASAILSFLPFS